MTNLEPNAGNWEMAIWETRGGCSERSATHPHSREQTNFATFRHLGLGVSSAPKASCSGLAWTSRLAFLHGRYFLLAIYSLQTKRPLKFVDIKIIPKDKNRVCLTVIDTSIQAPGVDSIAVSEFVNIG